MDKALKEQILQLAKDHFKSIIVRNHESKLRKLSQLKNYDYNPFLLKYISRLLSGDANSSSMAKALIYPRHLGTSINTIFGHNLQSFISKIMGEFGSIGSGLDIEFVDKVDGRKKYCQIKAGPNTINHDDVTTITNHFHSTIRLGRTNNLSLQYDDLCVGVLYGERSQLSQHYINIENSYPIYVGTDFWKRLTGDDNFYSDLIEAFGEVADEINGKRKLNATVKLLAHDIEAHATDL